jgi:hypothetical protein
MSRMFFEEFEDRLSRAGIFDRVGRHGGDVFEHLQGVLGGDAILVEVTDYQVSDWLGLKSRIIRYRIGWA